MQDKKQHLCPVYRSKLVEKQVNIQKKQTQNIDNIEILRCWKFQYVSIDRNIENMSNISVKY